jgi:hypothetical protein
MLIYLTTDDTPPVTYRVRRHCFQVQTLNLMQNWERISDALVAFCGNG